MNASVDHARDTSAEGANGGLRIDHALIAQWIRPGSRVLDLGCGDGGLLAYLQAERAVTGYGVEIEIDRVVRCIERGVSVIQGDLDAGLADFDTGSFDYVIMSLTLQAVYFPARLLAEMLRVGREGIVAFPNFGHISCRLQLAFGGHMPVSAALPETWYETDNIRLCTIRDFERLCHTLGIRILQRTAVDHQHRRSLGARLLPNLLGEMALYRFERKPAR
ncbi:MAG: methionine biosynthesis protein MetW [Immundisolibacter sp.]